MSNYYYVKANFHDGECAWSSAIGIFDDLKQAQGAEQLYRAHVAHIISEGNPLHKPLEKPEEEMTEDDWVNRSIASMKYNELRLHFMDTSAQEMILNAIVLPNEVKLP